MARKRAAKTFDISKEPGIEPPGLDDAVEFARRSIGADLLAARDYAGLTRVELAEKLGVSRTKVYRAECGAVSVDEDYVAAVLKACGLPKDWLH